MVKYFPVEEEPKTALGEFFGDEAVDDTVEPEKPVRKKLMPFITRPIPAPKRNTWELDRLNNARILIRVFLGR